MMTEMDIETSVYYVYLMRLIAQEDYVKLHIIYLFEIKSLLINLSTACLLAYSV
jgi:hypothetical protein